MRKGEHWSEEEKDRIRRQRLGSKSSEASLLKRRKTQLERFPSLIERFMAKVEVTHHCWNWVGAKRWVGYGVIGSNGKTPTSSRVAYELFKGEIPDGFCVLHTCDNPACVNPDHLWLGTQSNNIVDMVLKGRQAKGDKCSASKVSYR